MRPVDQYVLLIEHPSSNNILKLIKACGEKEIIISDEESENLFAVINKNFELNHDSILNFDEELWETLEHIDISVDWIEVIIAYENKNQIKKYKENDKKIKLIETKKEENGANFHIEKQQKIKEKTPRIFLEVEEKFKDNKFINEFKSDREKLVKIIWELYKFSSKESVKEIKFQYSINWDLFYKLVVFVYDKILEETKWKIEQKNDENKEENRILNDSFKRINDICISLSTLTFLSPVASSRGNIKYAKILKEYAENQLGVCPFTALFIGFDFGHLYKIESNEENIYESQWLITNLIAVFSGFLSQFINDKKYNKILKSYAKSAYETTINEFPHGAESDYAVLISTMIRLINPDCVSKEHILRFIKTLKIEKNDNSHVASTIFSKKENLFNIDSLSLLISNPLINNYINYFEQEFIKKEFIRLLNSTTDIPTKEELWECEEVFDFEHITYQSTYYKSSRTLIAAVSTFWYIDEDPLSMIIEGSETLETEGFSKSALIFLIYHLLYFVDDQDFKRIKISHIAHQKLYKFLNKNNIKNEINEYSYQVLDYCSRKLDDFGVLFCEVITGILSELNFSNVIKVDFKNNHSVLDIHGNDEEIIKPIQWSGDDLNESLKRILKEVSNLREQPAIGIWERKYKNIIGDIKVLFGEIDTVCLFAFDDFYKKFTNEIINSKDIRWEEFARKYNRNQKASLGTIPKLFYEIHDFKKKNSTEFENILKKLDDKKIAIIVRKISESEQLQVSLNAIVKYRHQFSHSNVRLKLTSVKYLLLFVESDMNDLLSIFK